MPNVSVIVPIYNTEKYLSSCIDSILVQTFTDFELILVDDGSTDSSGKICDKYAKKDSRIVVIHKENGGANRARETGVNNAKGNWIMFVDSDDTITNNAIDILFHNASEKHDIIIGQIFSEKTCNSNISIETYRNYLIRGKYVQPVSKLIRKSLFSTNSFNFPNSISIGEDMLMNIQLSFLSTKQVIVIPNKIYNYNYRACSAINTRKNSIKYECDFWKILYSLIPINIINHYEHALFTHTYTQWKKFCEYQINIPQEWKTCILEKYLNENICKYKSDIPIINRILIKCDSQFIRFCLINLKKLRNQFIYIKNK